MRYMLLIYSPRPRWPKGRRRIGRAGHWAITIEEKRLFWAGEPLQPTATATTVRTEGGQPLIPDGPFAETKEQLGGYYILDCKDLDQAIAWAADPDLMQRPHRVRRDPPDRRYPAALRLPLWIMPPPADIRATAESVFRREHGRIIASLIRLCGSFDRAEEAMQEAFAAALADWARAAFRRIPAHGSRPPLIAS